MKPTSNRRQMTPREASDGITELIERGFITIVRIRRDGGRVVRWRPEVSEWWQAAAEYCMARDDGTVSEAHRKRVREAWLAIRDQVELNCAEQALIDEVMRFQ
jgi:hypothetical protein